MSTASAAAERVVAIHQPNFFPWLGYFDKIARADVFVMLDSVQFPKKQGTWMNRVQILVDGSPRWLTLPLDRAYHGFRTVQEMRFAGDRDWREETITTLTRAYRHAPHFEDVVPLVGELIHCPQDSVAEYNSAAVRTLAERLVDPLPQLVRSSDLAVEGSATELLTAITRAVEGTTYLCGSGADDYQEDERFAEAGLMLRYQCFDPVPYEQLGATEPVPGLSVLDALFNVGFDATRAMIGRRPSCEASP